MEKTEWREGIDWCDGRRRTRLSEGAPGVGGRRSYPADFRKSNLCFSALDTPPRTVVSGPAEHRWNVPLTRSDASDYLPKLVSLRVESMDWAGSNEADIQAPQPQAGEQTRVPGPDEDRGRSEDAQPASPSGADSAHGEDRREVDGPRSERGEGLPRDARIRLGSEIRELLERGRRKRTSKIDVFFAASPASRSRLGLIVPKHGRSIVERNRLKRRLREIGRRRVLPDLDARGVSADVLIRARHRAYESGFDSLAKDVREAVEELCSNDC